MFTRQIRHLKSSELVLVAASPLASASNWRILLFKSSRTCARLLGSSSDVDTLLSQCGPFSTLTSTSPLEVATCDCTPSGLKYIHFIILFSQETYFSRRINEIEITFVLCNYRHQYWLSRPLFQKH